MSKPSLSPQKQVEEIRKGLEELIRSGDGEIRPEIAESMLTMSRFLLEEEALLEEKDSVVVEGVTYASIIDKVLIEELGLEKDKIWHSSRYLRKRFAADPEVIECLEITGEGKGKR